MDMHACGFVFTGFLTLHCIVKIDGKAYSLWGVAPQLLLVLPISTAPAQRSVDCCLPAWSQLLLVSSNLLATNDVHHIKASAQRTFLCSHERVTLRCGWSTVHLLLFNSSQLNTKAIKCRTKHTELKTSGTLLITKHVSVALSFPTCDGIWIWLFEINSVGVCSLRNKSVASEYEKDVNNIR